MKIHFWDNPADHEERSAFRTRLSQEYSISTSIDAADLTDMDLLFVHGGDSRRLEGIQHNSPLVVFGSDATTQYSIAVEANRISYINADELSDRFDEIYKDLCLTANLSVQNVSEILFGIDPIFEGLLERFANASPFTADDALKRGKIELNNYVKALE